MIVTGARLDFAVFAPPLEGEGILGQCKYLTDNAGIVPINHDILSLSFIGIIQFCRYSQTNNIMDLPVKLDF
jgi:hypothetical protein